MNSLNELLINHLYNFPFNNVDLLLYKERGISLDEEDIREKMEEKRRGGYCFEHNKYFSKILSAAGYQSKNVLARVIYGNNDVDAPKTHLVNVVEANKKKFLIDAGFGPYNPDTVVSLDGEVSIGKNGKKFRIVKSNNKEMYRLEVEKDEGQFFSLYQFDLNEYFESDFKLSNFYTSNHPDSKFVKSLIVSIFVEGGVKFIQDLNFSHIDNNQRTDLTLSTTSELKKILKENFKIILTENEANKLFNIAKSFNSSKN